MHIVDLDYSQPLEQSLTIVGGDSELAEIFEARLNALREKFNLESEELLTRSMNSGGAGSARNRAKGGNFSRTVVSVFPPDISGAIIDADIPES